MLVHHCMCIRVVIVHYNCRLLLPVKPITLKNNLKPKLLQRQAINRHQTSNLNHNTICLSPTLHTTDCRPSLPDFLILGYLHCNTEHVSLFTMSVKASLD